MLYREIIAVCSQIQTKHINTVCGQNVELLNVKLAVYIYIYGESFFLKWLAAAYNTVQSVEPPPHFPYYTYSTQYKQNLTTCCTAYPKIPIVTQPVKKFPDL